MQQWLLTDTPSPRDADASKNENEACKFIMQIQYKNVAWECSMNMLLENEAWKFYHANLVQKCNMKMLHENVVWNM